MDDTTKAGIHLRSTRATLDAVAQAAASEGLSSQQWLQRLVARTLGLPPPSRTPARMRGGKRPVQP
jgi:hypothetical protein